MNPATLTALAYLITAAVDTGLTVSQVLKKVEETGIVPPEEWAKFQAEFDDGLTFWAGAVK